jgi:hypothetical protein
MKSQSFYLNEDRDMSHIKFLKVKIKSLTAESRIIRCEEARAGQRPGLRDALRAHRVNAVRNETRLTQLAYGFLRGRARTTIEPKATHDPDWKRVEAMVKKYGPEKVEAFTHWKS